MASCHYCALPPEVVSFVKCHFILLCYIYARLYGKRSWVWLMAVSVSCNNPEQVVCTHVPLSPSSIIWYWSRAVTLFRWDGFMTSHLWAHCLETGISSGPNADWVWDYLSFTCIKYGTTFYLYGTCVICSIMSCLLCDVTVGLASRVGPVVWQDTQLFL